MSKRIAVLGATGSIGRQSLEVIALSEDLELVAISAGSSVGQVSDLIGATGVDCVAMGDFDSAEALAEMHPGITCLRGDDWARELIESSSPDLVLNATVGFAGLAPTVAVLESGIDLALANKESLVAGGDLVGSLAESTGSALLPVDSEHAAMAQLLEGRTRESVERVTLTASGGPFRGFDEQQLAEVSVEMALSHPTWEMGGKITVDSATLMNKGLEVIEAHHLFGFDYDEIDVLVHPRSIVHALVSFVDGMQLAHLGLPDMRAPIGWALAYPTRPPLPVERLDLASIGTLEFEEVVHDLFPCLSLAEHAGRAGGTAPTILNAANEVAVAAFLSGRIGFRAIAETVAGALESTDAGPVHDFETVRDADRRARESASSLVARATRG